MAQPGPSRTRPTSSKEMQITLPTGLGREECIAVKAAEWTSFVKYKHETAKELTDRNGGTWLRRKPYCSVCSEALSNKKRVPIYHHHNSSLRERLYCDMDSRGWYNCGKCETDPHPYKIGERYAVLVTSSILNKWEGNRRENGYRGNALHTDFIGIPGAQIQDLEIATLAEYGNMGRPIDVLLCSGLNDILAGLSPHQIIDKMAHFRTQVELLGARGNSEPNSFAVCTVPLPPKCTRLPADNYRPATDRTEDIKQLNEMILSFNTGGGCPFKSKLAPRYHTWGLENSSIRAPALDRHREWEWREEEVENMLHLKDSTRLRMGKSAMKYFLYAYGILRSEYASKAEWHNAMFPNSRRKRAREELEWAQGGVEGGDVDVAVVGAEGEVVDAELPVGEQGVNDQPGRENDQQNDNQVMDDIDQWFFDNDHDLNQNVLYEEEEDEYVLEVDIRKRNV